MASTSLAKETAKSVSNRAPALDNVNVTYILSITSSQYRLDLMHKATWKFNSW